MFQMEEIAYHHMQVLDIQHQKWLKNYLQFKYPLLQVILYSLKKINYFKGLLESADEIPSNTNYYDGSLNLNVGKVTYFLIIIKKVNCHVISNPNECYKSLLCGKLIY
jgi:hypothetical protein